MFERHQCTVNNMMITKTELYRQTLDFLVAYERYNGDVDAVVENNLEALMYAFAAHHPELVALLAISLMLERKCQTAPI